MKKAVCLIVKNENRYLNEWVRWHLTQDFNHFYIYNTGVEDPKEVLKDFEPQFFTIVDWHNKYYFNMQIEAYFDCLEKAKQNQEEWLAFIDIDEFIYIPKNLLEETAEDIGVIYLQQRLFNANGQIKYEDEPVQERFTQICENIENFVDKKSIVRPSKTRRMGVHYPIGIQGKSLSGEFYYNHYYTKSLEEWEEKIKRGSCDPRLRKNYSSFFKYNPDLIEYNSGKQLVQPYQIGQNIGIKTNFKKIMKKMMAAQD